ncbi:MAG: hypothetical protein R3268_00135 [Acidiferrobacterales bacterium]|nr:hypothetical protein [Acidiferrobacterales bacterium]
MSSEVNERNAKALDQAIQNIWKTDADTAEAIRAIEYKIASLDEKVRRLEQHVILMATQFQGTGPTV